MCIFCEKYKQHENIVYENKTMFVIYDQFPVSKGHCLVIPKRHIPDYFAMNKNELIDMDAAIIEAKIILDKLHQPDGYNIGINNGIAAGQTVMNLHVHLIPRYLGDMSNPRGGVRGVIPSKQSY
ncbi:MAG: HIT family protein [Bacilli bacterium]|nr:HIT family protein [Bacilli bacterium]MBN2876796.1 HIT family protein [Bacilli bacterium]